MSVYEEGSYRHVDHYGSFLAMGEDIKTKQLLKKFVNEAEEMALGLEARLFIFTGSELRSQHP